MKKYTKVLVLALALTMMLSMSVFATGTIGKYTEGANVSIDPAKDETEVTGNNKFALTYDGNAVDAMYLLLVTDDAEFDKYGYPTASSIKYVNQATADANGVVKFDNVYPESITKSTIKLAGGDFASGLQDVGSLVPETPIGFNVSGTAISWNNSNDATYLLYNATVSDADIKADLALAVPAKALAATAIKGAIAENADGVRYNQSFEFSTVATGNYKLVISKPGKYVPKILEITVSNAAVSLNEIKLWLYGDVSYDGIADATDSAQIKRKFNSMTSVFGSGDEQSEKDRFLAADVFADDVIDATDAAQINRYFNNMSSVFTEFK